MTIKLHEADLEIQPRSHAMTLRLIVLLLGWCFGAISFAAVFWSTETPLPYDDRVPMTFIQLGHYVCKNHDGATAIRRVSRDRYRFFCRDSTILETTAKIK